MIEHIGETLAVGREAKVRKPARKPERKRARRNGASARA